MYSSLHFYIDLSWEEYISNPNDYLKNTFKLVDFIYQHKSQVFYNQEQIDDFVANCSELDKNFIKSENNKLQLIIENAIKANSNGYFFNICFSNENTSLSIINNTAISSISQHFKIALISLTETNISETVLAVRSNTDFEQIKFVIINELSLIHDWILNNSEPRTFNLSPKHGENGKGNQKGESVLQCSKNEASALLKNAIPDFRKKQVRLFNFDNKHETFIEFYYEGKNPSNQWHGFHLKNEEWEKRVPESVRKFYKKR